MGSRRSRRQRSLRLEAAWATHMGRVREVNQDDSGITDEVFVVADGMGGHRGGEVASAVAVETMLESFVGPDRTSLVRAVRDANRAVLERAAGDTDLTGMGTTLCALAIVDGPGGQGGDEVLAVANIGDSRVYRYDIDGLVQVTDDHSLVADLVRAGELTEEEAKVHPQRNILTRALGIEADPIIDSWELQPARNDRYLLCSDGLFNELDDGRIVELVDAGSVAEAANSLVSEAVAAGGHDNVTVLVVEVVDGPERSSGSRLPIGRARPERSRGHVQDLNPGDETGMMFRTVMASIAVLLAAFVLVAGVWARQGWFIGSDDGDVAIFRGRPVGILWFDPIFVEGGDLRVSLLDDSTRAAVEQTIDVGTLDEARHYIERFRADVNDR